MWWSIGGGIIIFALGMFIFLKPGLICVFCKHFLHKVAKSFCRLLHLHFVGDCKAVAGRCVPAT